MCDKAKYESLEGRVSDLEKNVRDMRSECQAGFTRLSQSLENLAAEFGTRMNTLDARLVEKSKWGDTLRRIVLVSAYTICAMAAFAAGLNFLKQISAIKL